MTKLTLGNGPNSNEWYSPADYRWYRCGRLLTGMLHLAAKHLILLW